MVFKRHLRKNNAALKSIEEGDSFNDGFKIEFCDGINGCHNRRADNPRRIHTPILLPVRNHIYRNQLQRSIRQPQFLRLRTLT